MSQAGALLLSENARITGLGRAMDGHRLLRAGGVAKMTISRPPGSESEPRVGDKNAVDGDLSMGVSMRDLGTEHQVRLPA